VYELTLGFCDHNQSHANAALALALGFLLPNGCLQQIAANRFSIPQEVIAILLQGFVRPSRNERGAYSSRTRRNSSNACPSPGFDSKRSGDGPPSFIDQQRTKESLSTL
jgi:hypothetical protein